MPKYEYKVVPAPSKGLKAKGVKAPEARFALSVETTLNQLGEDGWEYLRAELLPSDERSGLTGTTTNWRNVLVFRRALNEDVVTNIFGETGTTAPAVGVTAASIDLGDANEEDAFEPDMTEQGIPAGDEEISDADQAEQPEIEDTENRVLTGIERVMQQSSQKS